MLSPCRRTGFGWWLVLLALGACGGKSDSDRQSPDGEGCTPGDRRPSDESCGTCTCEVEGRWACSDEPCECTPGDVRSASDGCNECVCDASGAWSCTERDCPACVSGDVRPAGDGCNECRCDASGSWRCTQRQCECLPGDVRSDCNGCNSCTTCTCTSDASWSCEAHACECQPVSAPCPNCPPPREPSPNCGAEEIVVWAKDPAAGACCIYPSACVAPEDWPAFGSLGACEAGEDSCGDCAAPHATGRCIDGRCVLECDARYADCNADASDGCETNTWSSLDNCGACGVVCEAANTEGLCTYGTCELTCLEGYAVCDGLGPDCTTDVLSSPEHCGRCGNACPSETPLCFAGYCVAGE